MSFISFSNMSFQRGGERLVCLNAFQNLFINTIIYHPKFNTIKRCMSTTTATVIAPALTKATKPAQKQGIVWSYNKKIEKQSRSFKNTNTSQLEATQILEEMKEKGIAPNAQTYFTLVVGMSEQRHRNFHQHDRLSNWLKEFLDLARSSAQSLPALSLNNHRKSVLVKLGAILKKMTLRGHPKLKDMFLEIIDSYSELGEPVENWNRAIEGCAKAKSNEDAEELLNMLREKKMANSYSYHILIKYYLQRCEDQKAASRIFSLMIQDKVTATEDVYYNFIQYYASVPIEDPEEKEVIVDTMTKLWQAVLMTANEHNKQVDGKTIQLLLYYFGRNGKLAEAEQVYMDMKARQQRLNRVSLKELNMVIIAFAKKRKLKSAISLTLDLVGQEYKLSECVLLAVIEACIRVDDTEAAHQIVTLIKESNPEAEITQPCLDLLKSTNKETAEKESHFPT